MKGKLEETLEEKETYYHQWGAHLASAYRRTLERYGAKPKSLRLLTILPATAYG